MRQSRRQIGTQKPTSLNRPIGILDSGVGGLTVAQAVIRLLPNERVVYFGDTARAPYGSNPPDVVLEDASRVARYLVNEHDVKLLVLACNTTAAVLLSRRGGGLVATPPVVEILRPGVRALIEAGGERAGVIATETTIASGAYQQTLEAEMRGKGTGTLLSFLACPGFVEFAERGETDSSEVRDLARRLLRPLLEAGVEKVLLGCSHFPILSDVIQEVMGEQVELVSSAEATALAVSEEMQKMGALAEAGGAGEGGQGAGGQADRSEQYTWLVSGESDGFHKVGRDLLDLPMEEVKQVSELAPMASENLSLKGAA